MTNLQLKEKGNNKDLIEAVKVGNKDEVIKLLNLGTNVNYIEIVKVENKNNVNEIFSFINKNLDTDIFKKTYEYKTTSLMYACEKGYKEIVELLIEKGANINFKDNNNWTALLCACRNGYLEIVDLLINNGAKVKKALPYAVMSGKKELVELLIKVGCDINYNSEKVSPAISVACYHEYKEIVELLISKEANINLQPINGYPSLIAACLNGHIGIVKLLIKNKVNVNLIDGTESTSLIYACQQGYTKIVEILIKNGANINSINKWNETPLICVLTSLETIRKGTNIEITKILIKNGVNVENTLSYAVMSSNKKLVKMIIEEGANINYKNEKGMTALLYSFDTGCEDIVKLLLINETFIDYNDQKYKKVVNYIKKRILISYIKDKNIEKIFILIDKYKDIIDFNSIDEEGNNAFHHAVVLNNVELLKILFDNKCNINLINNKGETPLYISISNNNVDKYIVSYLVNRGALLNSPSYINTVYNYIKN